MRKLLLGLVLLGGCSDHCVVGTTRCDRQEAQICMSNGNWEVMQSCPQVDPPFVCCAVDGGHTCLPSCGGDQ